MFVGDNFSRGGYRVAQPMWSHYAAGATKTMLLNGAREAVMPNFSISADPKPLFKLIGSTKATLSVLVFPEKKLN